MLIIFQRPVRFTLLLLLFTISQLVAQSGSVSGTVYDTDGSTTLPGASVYLEANFSAGTASDYDGTFLLTNVPTGSQTILISYTGYETKAFVIEVAAGEVTTLEAVLSATVYSGETILVTAQALGQAKAINQQLNSDAIANFVSADKIKELPDVNAAEAISRLPGVAINRSGGEGSKVVVRGLDPKFTAISINGVRLPSTSGTDRSVDLSLISPELLSGIELFKSPLPDMDGDALGGSINLNIIKAPKERTASIKGLAGYNDLTGTYQDYKLTGSVAQRLFKGKLGVIATANIERFNRSGEAISQSWGDNTSVILDTIQNAALQEGNSLSYDKELEIRKRYNGSLGLDYNIGKKSDVTLLGIFSRTTRDQFIQQERYDVNNSRLSFTPEIRESAIDLYSLSLSARHQLGKVKIEWGTAYSEVTGETPNNFVMDFFNTAAPFDLAVFEDDNRGKPEEFFNFVQYKEGGTYLQEARSIVSGNSEKVNTAFINLELPFSVSDNVTVTFKTGAKFTGTTKDRFYNEAFEKNYYLRPNTYFGELTEGEEGFGTPLVDPTGGFYYGIENFTNNGVINFERANGENYDLLTSFEEERLGRFQQLFEGDFIPNRYGIVNNYDLKERVYAGYTMVKINVGQQFTAIPGFRYELSDNAYNAFYSDLAGDFGEDGFIRDTSAKVNYNVPMPHLHLKYKPLDWLDFRASYSTTLARPDFDYIVPATAVNRSGDVRVTQGNPNLKASVSRNYDFFVTAFSGKWGLLSGGVFYKDISDAFYPQIIGLNTDSIAAVYGFEPRNVTGGILTTYQNSANSFVKGFEVEIQSNLNFLPGALNGLVFNVNYTRLNSETTINSFRREVIIRPPVVRRLVIPFQREAALVGQARDILNLSLGYDYKRTFSARVSTSYQGDKLSGYSDGATKDRFNQGFWRVDAAFKYKFNSGLNLFLNLNNISDQKDRNFYTSLDQRFITSVTRYGPTATVGAEYKFSGER